MSRQNKAARERWKPPTLQVTFCQVKCWGGYKTYINTVGIFAMTSQKRHRADTRRESLLKAQAHARKLHPDVIISDDITYL